MGRRIALKLLPKHRTSDPDRVARFVREVRASAALNHPSIVAVHDAGSDGDVHFLAMELIDGEALSEWMRKRHSIASRVELMAQVAEGLARSCAGPEEQFADVYALVVYAVLLYSDLARPEAAAWYSMLLAEGGYGRLPRERAAFLIRESDGTLTLEPWPDSGHRQATFRGRIPDRTLAVLHTHPKGENRPSQRDRQEARRLRMPVVVITPEAVIAAMPDGLEVIVHRFRRESRSLTKDARVAGTETARSRNRD